MTSGEIHDALTDLWEYFDDRADVIDGDYGEPRPNEDMHKRQAIEAIQDYVQRLEARAMTHATECWLVAATTEARDYIARKFRGEADKGQYEGLEIARTLTAVLNKVTEEQQRGIAAALSEAR